jgi:predicted GH43/DUF377 family glycosyl hydrolase
MNTTISKKGELSVTDTTTNWLTPQRWHRDTETPCISLGAAGDFDDMHIFAPCVAFENGRYFLWYCGSQGAVADRVFRLGLATSDDGVNFTKHPESPVYAFGDGRHSILTPALLRNPDGSVCREAGKLRMWFSSTDFPAADGRHTLHETSSIDGLTWAQPSPPQLEGAYAPTLLKEGDTYHLWYTDVSANPWCIRHAQSPNGRDWQVTAEPVLQIDQAWEHGNLFYPTVLKADEHYLMWYGSYQMTAELKTALGFAVSTDGIHWQKHPNNPVFGPDASRAWESHYTTSQSILRLPDGSWRIWYASRTKPPFTHKYFAIGTAVWDEF